ncbi:MAG: hypothetical protein E7586_00695 [Ruminococcaceae bacterium]|nr:hypothetical protein [Oscillospiraceae bacterium]
MYFITICTQDRRNILSRVITPQNPKNVGVGVPDDPQKDNHVYLNATVELLPKGIIADKYINQLDAFYNDMSVENYVIMPNHVHLLLWVKSEGNGNGTSRTPFPTIQNSGMNSERGGTSRTPFPTIQNSKVSRFVSTFKRFCDKEYGRNIWQKSFYDHVIRNQEDYEKHIDYICNNPVCWEFDKLYSDE